MVSETGFSITRYKDAEEIWEYSSFFSTIAEIVFWINLAITKFKNY